MTNRTKILVHLRRLSNLFEQAFRNGPDGSLEGKFGVEHEQFVHHSCSFYLAGCLAYLEGEDGAYSWNIPGVNKLDFDDFVKKHPLPPKESFAARGISKASMKALAEIRNAVTHNDGDLSKNLNTKSKNLVASAGLPGVSLTGSKINLDAPFLDFVRLSSLAVRNFHGDG
ncbi:MAG: hypothetical protein RPU34_04070 [Candidatus Sedimenticola sp. (ex Thyasira tokunagai)]